jgi:hypothetical protein
MRKYLVVLAIFVCVLSSAPIARASGGPLGIDHRWQYDNHGIWTSHRDSPLIIGWLPGGFSIGFVHRF